MSRILGPSLGGALSLAAMEALFGGYANDPSLTIDLRDIRDPLDRLQDIRRVLDTRKPSRRKGLSAAGPTSKRATVKAARKANIRRLRS